MIITAVISVITFLLLAASILFFPSVKIGKLKIGAYWLIALTGAALLLIINLTPFDVVIKGLTNDSAINPLKILVLFFSMTFLSVYLDEVGMFRYLAKKAAKIAGENQFRLFIVLYLLIAVLTVFTSNDIIILTLTPFICFFCKNTKIDPMPYLVSEFAVANTWSMMLIIGNPTNIYLATAADIGFAEYIKVMALPTLAAGIVEFLLIMFIFRKKLKARIDPQTDDFRIKSRPDLVIGIVHLAACLVFLVISGYINMEMWLISAICALSLLVCSVFLRFIEKGNGAFYLKYSFRRLPWQLIPFVLSMFVIVICLSYQGVSGRLGELLGDSASVWKYGFSSFLCANVINNIPMSILFSTLPSSLAQGPFYQAVYASVVGSNIGAFLTPIGALAGIMFTEITEGYRVDYGFRQFIKYGVIIALPTITSALLVLSLLL